MKTLSPPVRIAIAGLGDVSLDHKRALDHCAAANLVGAWTRNGKKRSTLTGEWNVKAYPTFEDIIADDGIDVVDITAADEVHFDFAMRAMGAGKHVILEKPPADNSKQVTELKETSEKTGLFCIPMHNYAYRPRMLQTKSLIDEGRIGRITFGFFSEVMHQSEEWAPRYHGVLITAMYHLIYASLFFLGRPDGVFAQQESLHYQTCKDDDLTTLHLHYPSGTMAVLLGNWAGDDITHSSWFSLYKLLATEGSVSVSGHDSLVYKRSGWGSYEYPDYEDSFIHAIDFMVNRCFVEGKEPISGLQDAIDTQIITELAQRSSREGRLIPTRFDLKV